MQHPPGILARTLQSIFFLAFLLWLGLSIYGMWHPSDPFSKTTDALFVYWGALIIQLGYPLFVLATRRLDWSGGWRTFRTVQAVAVGLIVAGFVVLLLTTVDVSGFRS